MEEYKVLEHTEAKTADERLEELIRKDKIPYGLHILGKDQYSIKGLIELRLFPDGFECLDDSWGEKAITLYCKEKNMIFYYKIK